MQKPKYGGDRLIYEKIKMLCKERKISICALEKKAGLGNGVISGWKISSPTVEKIQAVAKILDVRISELIE
jgi:transcriptional regulator with XRE-family HTH domain